MSWNRIIARPYEAAKTSLVAVMLKALISIAWSSSAYAQFDYTPGFEPGPPAEITQFYELQGEWDITLFAQTGRDGEGEWQWVEWATTSSTIVTILGGAALYERNQGFPIGENATGAGLFSNWEYEMRLSFDRFSQTYRAVIIDNLWGLEDIYEGQHSDGNLVLSNFDTQTFNRTGEGRSVQKNQIEIREISSDGFVLEWATLDAPEMIAESGRADQPWEPSVRMVYRRRQQN
ncbi:hypothetical protein [Hyphobacterium sp.]|uniref:hypothetical protein n=1 Tax=Hyphobacterium sp. TaxID=2004662 RepID=UPI003748130C